ncbi:hypothetical protein [Micromonospora sp. NPDC005189]|uniref:hypothetical protein n=1 Tax=unclassified Micromonospora TaxID=2617518 RepID=UPI0033A57494
MIKLIYAGTAQMPRRRTRLSTPRTPRTTETRLDAGKGWCATRPIDDLPPGFNYAQEFIRVIELGLTDLEPWLILDGDRLRERHRGLRGRYPNRVLVPFARRIDNDNVASPEVLTDAGQRRGR